MVVDYVVVVFVNSVAELFFPVIKFSKKISTDSFRNGNHRTVAIWRRSLRSNFPDETPHYHYNSIVSPASSQIQRIGPLCSRVDRFWRQILLEPFLYVFCSSKKTFFLHFSFTVSGGSIQFESCFFFTFNISSRVFSCRNVGSGTISSSLSWFHNWIS